MSNTNASFPKLASSISPVVLIPTEGKYLYGGSTENAIPRLDPFFV
jgi:hypothetical protein